MTNDQNYAVNLFKYQYGKTPEDAGCPVSSYYEQKNLYLYSDSQEAIDAFKSCQNVLAWMLKYFFGLLFAVLAIAIYLLLTFEVSVASIAIVCGGICLLFGVALIAIFVYCRKQEKTIRKHTILAVHYEVDED